MITEIILPNNNSLVTKIAQSIDAILGIVRGMPVVAVQLDNLIGIGKDEIRIHSTNFVMQNPCSIANIGELREGKMKVDLETVLSTTAIRSIGTDTRTVDFPASDRFSSKQRSNSPVMKLATAMSTNPCVSGNCFPIHEFSLACVTAKLWIASISSTVMFYCKFAAAPSAYPFFLKVFSASRIETRRMSAFLRAKYLSVFALSNAIGLGIKGCFTDWTNTVRFAAKFLLHFYSFRREGIV